MKTLAFRLKYLYIIGVRIVKTICFHPDPTLREEVGAFTSANRSGCFAFKRLKMPSGKYPRKGLEERLAEKFQINHETGCYEWTGALMPNGYGEIGRGAGYVYAHRAVLELFVNPIPEGMSVDHLCRNRKCINPDHLEVVTIKVNTLRGIGPATQKKAQTHCKNGHEFTPKNTYVKPNGCRDCRICKNERKKV
jgi:hypothetical protein